MEEFENGLARFGHSGVVHLISPAPPDGDFANIRPWCRPNKIKGEATPVEGKHTAITCGRCLIRHNAPHGRVA